MSSFSLPNKRQRNPMGPYSFGIVSLKPIHKRSKRYKYQTQKLRYPNKRDNKAFTRV